MDISILNYISMCVYPSTEKGSPEWNRTMNVLPDIQASDVLLRKLFCVKNLRFHVIVNYSRDLQASNCARVSSKPGKATRSKTQLLKLWKIDPDWSNKICSEEQNRSVHLSDQKYDKVKNLGQRNIDDFIKIRETYSKNPILGYLNINSLRNKIINLREVVEKAPIDILCID